MDSHSLVEPPADGRECESVVHTACVCVVCVSVYLSVYKGAGG